jgi:hypothetical protein
MSAIFGRDLTHPDSIRSYRKHIIDLTLAGLKP